MKTNWEKRIFQLASGSLKETETETKLPFSIGGVTRQGFEHIRSGISNQDAINFKIDDDFIVAVVCDGCTSSDISNVSNFSSNEIGARLLAEYVANFCYYDIKPRKNRIKIEPFLRRLNTEIHLRLKRFLKACLVKDSHQNPFLFHMMTSTLMVTIIRRKEFFVLHSGDGCVGINGQTHNLDAYSGSYMTNTFDPNFKSSKPLLQLLKEDDTKNLNTLYMATDGFAKKALLQNTHFKSLISKQESENGFIDLVPEIHLELIEPYYQNHHDLEHWPTDDASLIMIRRTLN